MSSKRTNIFGQGRPENPYAEREDEPADPPKKATAAQMATRKIKSAKTGRRPGTSSGISPSPSPQPNIYGGGDTTASTVTPSFGYGASQPAQPAQNGGAFNGVFGGLATNSFPPTQPSAPSNTFSSSSFPSFGGNATGNSNSTGSTFNPQPPSAGFSFVTGGTNPFAASAPAPSMNGAGNSIFNTTPPQPQQANQLFPVFGQSSASAAPSMFSTSTSNMFGTSASSTPQPKQGNPPFPVFEQTSSAPAGNSIFGQTSSATTGNMFGAAASSTPGVAPATPTTTTAANPFPSLQSAPSAPSSSLFQFGSTKPAPAATQSGTPASSATASAPSLFNGTPASTAPTTSSSNAPASAPFSIFGAASQGATTGTPVSGNGLFQNLTTTSQSMSATTAPTVNMFGASAPTSNMFGSSAPTSNIFGASTPSGNMFDASTPAGNMFGASTPAGNMFGATTPDGKMLRPLSGTKAQGEANSTPGPGPIATPIGTKTPNNGSTFTPKSSFAPKTSFGGIAFGGVGSTVQTDQSAKVAPESTPAKTGLFAFSTAQATIPEESTTKEPETTATKNGLARTTFSSTVGGTSSSIFAQSNASGPSDSSPFSFPASNKKPATAQSTPSLFSQSQPASSSLGDSQKTSSSISQQKNDTPEPKQNAPQSSFSMASSSTQQQALPMPASTMPTLTGSVAQPVEAPKTSEVTKIAKVHLPAKWGDITTATETDLKGLAVQLASLNNQYRSKLTSLPAEADWTSLSQWHFKATSDIMQKIIAAKKQSAAAKGITGNESSLSVKRKANVEDDATFSPKKPRGYQMPTTPTPKALSLFSTTPKATPPSKTASLFGNVLTKGTSSTTSEEQGSVPAKTNSPNGGFSLFSNSATPTSSKPAASQLNFLGQFKAKSYDELVAERKAKDKDNDYDSEDESYDEWSARWDQKEAERVANEKETTTKEVERVAKDQEAATPSVEASVPPKPSTSSLFASSTPSVQASAPSKQSTGSLFASSTKSSSGTSSPGLLGSRTGSPAISTGDRSVFDTPEVAQSPPGSNPFAHLSQDQSSQDESSSSSEGEEVKHESLYGSQPAQSSGQAQPNKRKISESESDSESEESLEENMRRKKQAKTGKPSLAARITRDGTETEESEKENGDLNKSVTFGRTNGVQTPSRPFAFFDFDGAAGAKSAPPKQQDTSGEDNTFKAGTPIKFGTVSKANPVFQFQPATPKHADFSATPSKPPTTFSFLNAATNSPAPASAISSRAPTPLSEAETSGKESAADKEDEEGSRQETMDISALTDAELANNNILFHANLAIAKHQVLVSGEKSWETYARGPHWILQNKETGKAFVRVRNASGITLLNYNILPKLKTTVTGTSMRMVNAIGTKMDGKTSNIVFAFKSSEIAAEFSNIYNNNLPA